MPTALSVRSLESSVRAILGPSGDLVRASLVVALASAVWALARTAARRIYRSVHERVLVTLEVPSRDESFAWLVTWLHEHPDLRDSRTIIAHTEYDEGEERRRARLCFTPAPGSHAFNFEGKTVWLTREREDAPDVALGGRHETITLTARADTALLRRLLESAKERAFEREKGRVAVHVARRGSWSRVGSEERRALASVVLASGVKEDLVADIAQFLASRDWYRSVGVPYRRGYLLHGPPGTGKSSAIKAVASHFGLGLALVSLQGAQELDDLRGLLHDAPPHCLLVLEDADGGAVTAGLLNAVDGVAAQEGRILVVTTNDRTSLPPALTRPGRIDRQFYFGLTTRAQAREYFRAFYDGVGDAEAFASGFQPDTYSMAELQKYLMLHRHEPTLAVAHVGDMRRVVADLDKEEVISA